MPWTLFAVPNSRRAEVDPALADDVVSRQSQKIRAAGPLGGPAESTYVLVEGSAEGVHRAEELLGKVGEKLPAAPAEAVYRKFKDEEEAASAGMGLFFTEG